MITAKNKQNLVKFSFFTTTKNRTFVALEVAEGGFLVDKSDSHISQKICVFYEHLFLIYCENLW